MYSHRSTHGPVDLAFTDRYGGVSAVPYDSLNLALEGGDDPEATAANLDTVLADFAPGASVADLHQVHGAVVDVVDSPAEIGFVHAALVGHPQRGFESYVVRRHPDGTVTLDIRVVWRPAAWWMRAAGPLGALALSLILRRNLRALDPVVAHA